MNLFWQKWRGISGVTPSLKFDDEKSQLEILWDLYDMKKKAITKQSLMEDVVYSTLIQQLIQMIIAPL